MFTDRKLLSVVKVSVMLNLISRFSAIPAEISYSVHTDKPILKFIWRDRRSTAANTTLGKSNAASGPTLPGFRAYCEATGPRQQRTGAKTDKQVSRTETELRNRPTYVWSTALWQRSKSNAMEQRQSFQETVLKPDSHMPKKPKKLDTDRIRFTCTEIH